MRLCFLKAETTPKLWSTKKKQSIPTLTTGTLEALGADQQELTPPGNFQLKAI